MANCFVKDLKTAVSDDNLQRMNSVVLNVYAEDNADITKRIIILRASGGTVSAKVIEGSIRFYTSDGQEDKGTEISTAGSLVRAISNGNGKILIENKYCLKTLAFYTNGANHNDYRKYITAPVGHLDYAGNNAPGSYFTIQANNRLIGNLSNWDIYGLEDTVLKYAIELVGTFPADIHLKGEFNIQGTPAFHFHAVNIGNSEVTKFVCYDNKNVIGTFEDCATTTLTTLNAQYSSLSGNVEDFYEALWGKNVRTGTYTVVAYGANQLFNGQPILSSKTYSGVFSASGISITVNGTEVATYNGSSWTYA